MKGFSLIAAGIAKHIVSDTKMLAGMTKRPGIPLRTKADVFLRVGAKYFTRSCRMGRASALACERCHDRGGWPTCRKSFRKVG
jgi:hypothetical protein